MSTQPEPSVILETALQRALAHLETGKSILSNLEIIERVEFVCRNPQNRACARLLLACLVAKSHQPHLDIRKPYTEIGSSDCYSGRTYDETYITPLIHEHELPCNPTTAFLTPALRNKNTTLTADINLVGKPPILYHKVLRLLSDVNEQKVDALTLLSETFRWLLVIRDEKRQRIKSLLADLATVDNQTIPLSAEAIVKLIQQHLSCRGASRLPVLIVAAAYQTVSKEWGERILPLRSHLAADKQTGTVGDLEITLMNEDRVVTSYEMKTRRVTIDDLNRALQKVKEKFDRTNQRIDNYIFITTDSIEIQVEDYARILYDRTEGIEFAILDCLGFIRHFLHLFHRRRSQFLEKYQELVLSESDSAVSQPLKEAFLALRQAAESLDTQE